MTADEIRETLKVVIDPELGINMVDLGLLYKVEMPKAGGIRILMTLTTPGCPLAPYFVEQVQAVLGERFGLEPELVEVQITFDPPWTQDMMDEESLAQLGLG